MNERIQLGNETERQRENKNVELVCITYREVFSNVGDLFFGFLGNPKAPNFCKSFLHFLLTPLTDSTRASQKEEEEEREEVSFTTFQTTTQQKSPQFHTHTHKG